MSSNNKIYSDLNKSINKPSMIEAKREERSVDKPSAVKPPKK